MDIITETVNHISGKVKDDIQTMKKKYDSQRLDQTNVVRKTRETANRVDTEYKRRVEYNQEWYWTWNVRTRGQAKQHQRELSSLMTSFKPVSGMFYSYQT